MVGHFNAKVTISFTKTFIFLFQARSKCISILIQENGNNRAYFTWSIIDTEHSGHFKYNIYEHFVQHKGTIELAEWQDRMLLDENWVYLHFRINIFRNAKQFTSKMLCYLWWCICKGIRTFDGWPFLEAWHMFPFRSFQPHSIDTQKP